MINLKRLKFSLKKCHQHVIINNNNGFKQHGQISLGKESLSTSTILFIVSL